jgi:hypothetical protein
VCYKYTDPFKAVLQADWLSKYPQLVAELHVPCSFSPDEYIRNTDKWEKEQQLQERAGLLLLHSIADKGLAPRKLVLFVEQPSEFLQRISTKQLQSLSLGGDTSLLLTLTALLQGLQLPALRKLSLALYLPHEQQQQQEQQQRFVAALSAASGLQCLRYNLPLPAAATSQLPSSLLDLTLSRLPGGASVAHLAQLTRLVLHNPCCDARELAAAAASLPQLRQLELSYCEQPYDWNKEDSQQERAVLKQVQQHAASWGGLQQLQHLVIDLPHGYWTEGECDTKRRSCVPCCFQICVHDTLCLEINSNNHKSMGA